MSGVEAPTFDASGSLSDILATIPADELDTVEVEGGLTWRQAAILGLTHGYLRIPGDEAATPPFDTRLGVRLSVDRALRTHFAEHGQPESAKAVLIFCLEAAAGEYDTVCQTSPEWINDKYIVDDLLTLWRDRDEPYATELLASNILYYMYPTKK